MPSRRGVVLILAFWLAVTGYVGYRDAWPRLFADAPPAIRIDLSDEATQTVPARWTVYRGTQKVGTLTTVMSYVPDDNSFRFASTYRDLKFDVSGLHCHVSELTTTMHVGRGGDLRGQSMHGKLTGKLMAGPVPIFDAEATAAANAIVKEGMLFGSVEIRSLVGNVDQPLDPVPVPAGQVLNPLLPVNRLRDVRPGRRWVVHEVNPLADALSAMGRGLMKQHAGSQLLGFGAKRESAPFVAEVLSSPENLTRKDGVAVPCWVIEYRRDGAAAKTWVAVEDGKVLRQEAGGFGEVLRLERED